MVLVDDPAEHISSPDRANREHLGSGFWRVETETEVGALSVVVGHIAAQRPLGLGP